MFDVGFSELLVIGIVALLVIGPEKLPSVARTVGALLGRMQRYVNDVKADINREIELDELKKLQTTVQDAAKSIETSMNETMSGFQTQADELNKIASGESLADPSGLTEPAPALSSPAEPAVESPVAPAGIEPTAVAGTHESVSHQGAQASLPLAQASLPLGDAPVTAASPVDVAPAIKQSV